MHARSKGYCICPVCMCVCVSTHIVHPESFISNAQNAIGFARRNRPRVNHSGEFACVRLHAFASTVRVRAIVRT